MALSFNGSGDGLVLARADASLEYWTQTHPAVKDTATPDTRLWSPIAVRAPYLPLPVFPLSRIPSQSICLVVPDFAMCSVLLIVSYTLHSHSVSDAVFTSACLQRYPGRVGTTVQCIVWTRSSSSRLFTAGLHGSITEYDLVSFEPKARSSLSPSISR